MTVSTAYAPLNYTGNGSTTVFSVTWPFFTGSLIVTLVSAAGIETVKTISTHYTVSGGTTADGLPATGSVTMLTAPASGETLRIARATPKLQSSTWTNGGAFQAKTVEATVDRLMLIAQEGGGSSGGGGGDPTGGDSIQFVSSGADPDYWDAEDSILRNLADPVDDTDAVPKGYADINYGGAAAATAVAAASAAASSATNAATSATNAASAWDDFDDRYLGSKASDPLVDNDGDALEAGALYWSTAIHGFRVYTGSGWVSSLSEMKHVATRTELAALDISQVTAAVLTESGREGVFTAVNASIPITDTGQGLYVPSDTAGWCWERLCGDNRIEATWFGVVADYSFTTDTGTDNAAAVGYALDVAVALSRDLRWPAGAIRLGSRVERSYAGDVTFSAHGVSQMGTKFVIRSVENTSGGIKITLTNVSATMSVAMSRFTFFNRGDGGANMNCGTALEFERNPVPSLRVVRELFLDEIDTYTYNNDDGYFSYGIVVTGVRLPLLSRCRIQNPFGPGTTSGRHRNDWIGYLGERGISFINCYGPAVRDCHVRAVKTGYYYYAVSGEGGEAHNSTAVEVKVGIEKDGIDNQPGFLLKGAHLNYRDTGVLIRHGRNLQIADIAFYNENASDNGDGDTTPCDILLEDFDYGVAVHNCTSYWDGQYATGRRFIRSESPRATAHISVTGNNGANATVYAMVENATTLTMVCDAGNVFPNIASGGARIVNVGIVEMASTRVPVSGGGYAPASVGTPTSAATKSSYAASYVLEHDGNVALQMLSGATAGNESAVCFGNPSNTSRIKAYTKNDNKLYFSYLGTDTAILDNFGRFNLIAGTERKFQVNSVNVVGARKTGWATATGTATRTTFDTATVTTAQLAERVKALIDDLHGTAGHGLIGT